MAESNITIQDVMKLIDKVNEANDKRMLSLVQEIRKPTDVEQRKIDNDNAILERKREMRRQELLSDEATRKSAQRACLHQKKHPRSGAFISAWGGQVNSDGCWHPICTVCQMEGPAVKAPMEWVTGGVNATDPDNPWMAQLKLETLFAWQKQLGGPPEKRILKPIGA